MRLSSLTRLVAIFTCGVAALPAASQPESFGTFIRARPDVAPQVLPKARLDLPAAPAAAAASAPAPDRGPDLGPELNRVRKGALRGLDIRVLPDGLLETVNPFRPLQLPTNRPTVSGGGAPTVFPEDLTTPREQARIREFQRRLVAAFSELTAKTTAQIRSAQGDPTVFKELQTRLETDCVEFLGSESDERLRAILLTQAANGGSNSLAAQPGGGLRNKAVYGADDSFNLGSYKLAHDRGHAAVALFEDGANDHFCSGFLVAPDLVMTALHCMARRVSGGAAMRDAGEIANLRVRFGDFRGGSLVAPTEAAVAELVFPGGIDAVLGQKVAAGAFSSSLPDVAILRLTADAPFPEIIKPMPMCRPGVLTKPGDPVVVVGHPQGSQGVAMDNAGQILPHLVSKNDRGLAICRLVTPILRVMSHATTPPAAPDGSPSQVSADTMRSKMVLRAGEILAQIDRSYRAADQGRFEFHHPDYGEDMPALVLDADARAGVSGAAILHRNKMCVVGVFVRGAEEIQIEKADWFSHEIGMPTALIRKNLCDKNRALAERMTFDPPGPVAAVCAAH